jgi:hypothetical protein
MRTAQEWTEPDIQALITEQRPEDLSLEYKAAAALDKTQGKKADISKDVSAMANSAGGTIIYGINEQKSSNGPIILDPVDPAQISIEWLEQVIDSGIQRRIPGLRIHRIGLKSSPSRVVYVVSIPPSNLAPHIASDHRFHKRLGTTTAMMEEYEVRDVSRRLDAPALEVFLPMALAPPSLVISPYVENKSPAPALYASIRLFVPVTWIPAGPISVWNQSDVFQVTTEGNFWEAQALFYNWSVPREPAILSGFPYDLPRLLFAQFPPSYVAWEILSPQMEIRRGCFLVVPSQEQPAVRLKPKTLTSVELLRIKA